MSALVFQLFGPLAAWGELAVGEERPVADRPGRSALLGLLGAALGVQRSDAARQSALAAAVCFGVEVRARGTPFWDFHTAQTATRAAIGRAKGVRNRAELLGLDDIETILSRREYRSDAFARIAVFAVEGAAPEFGLAHLAAALERPAFELYLGRRSCPPALPLDPQLVEADDLEAALEAAALRKPAVDVLRAIRPSYQRAETTLYWEDGVPTGIAPARIDRTTQRRDVPVSRRQWLFATRAEHQKLSSPEAEAPCS